MTISELLDKIENLKKAGLLRDESRISLTHRVIGTYTDDNGIVHDVTCDNDTKISAVWAERIWGDELTFRA